MRRVVFMMLAVLVAIGCGKKEEPKPAQTVQQVVSQPRVEETPQQKEQREATEREEYKRRSAQNRAEDLMSVREHFLPNKYPGIESRERGWRDNLYGAYRPPFATACRDYLQFEGLHGAFQKVGDFDYNGNGKLTWDEVGLPEKQAVAKHRGEGLRIARDFMDIFKVPLEDRVLAKECITGGEGAGFRFTDTNVVSRTIDDLLEKVEAEPKDIGATTESWRSIVLTDFRQRIERLKGGKEESYRLTIAHEAAERWHFKPDEVGLTPEEIKLYEAQYADTNR